MPQRVIRQPNGNLALFTSVSDHFLYCDCTPDEMREILIGEYDYNRRDTAKKIQAGLEDWLPYREGVRGTGLTRWHEDAFTALVVHGPEDADLQDVLKSSGMTDDEIARWNAAACQARLELDAEDGTAIRAPEIFGRNR